MQSRRWGLWAWGVTAPVILVAILVMRADIGACTATFGFGKDEVQAANCFEFWVNRQNLPFEEIGSKPTYTGANLNDVLATLPA